MNPYTRARAIIKGPVLGAVVCALALVGSGCAKPTAQVTGTAKFKGKALTSGVVVFVEQETNRSTPPAYIQPDGTYFVPVAPVGPAIILVQTPRLTRPDGVPKDSPEMKLYEQQSTSYVAIPARYVDLNGSGIKFDLQPGSNVFDVNLQE